MRGFGVGNGERVNGGDVMGYVGRRGGRRGKEVEVEYEDKENGNVNGVMFREWEKRRG